jgi:hypothetical protein
VVADLFGAALSVGTLVNLVRQAAERVHGVEREIKTALLGVVGAEGARMQWTHVTRTPTRTHYTRHPARGATALDALGVFPGYRGVSAHDGWTSYIPQSATSICTVCTLRWRASLVNSRKLSGQRWGG